MMLQDVYTEIAQLVQKQVDLDEARGVPEATVLRDNVDRKLVKQTVMTSVYGVTFVGARHQIGNRLKERGWEDDRLVYKASCYGARVSPHPTCMHHSKLPSQQRAGGGGGKRGQLHVLIALAGLQEWLTPPLHTPCPQLCTCSEHRSSNTGSFQIGQHSASMSVAVAAAQLSHLQHLVTFAYRAGERSLVAIGIPCLLLL